MTIKSNKTVSILMLLAGALLVGFSAGRWQAPLAAWIGPVFILRYARDHKDWRGYLIIFATYILAFIIGFMAIWLGAGWPLPLIVILPVFYGFLWSLPYLADRLLSPRLRGFSGTFVYSLAVTTLEFVNIHTNPIGVWGSTGFTQYGNLPIMQLASVTGMIGITFLMGWFASVVNWVWENKSHGTEIIRGLVIFGTVVSAVFLFGFLRLNLTPLSETGRTVRVAGIIAESQTSWEERAQASGLDNESYDQTTARELLESHWNVYFDKTVREAQAGAKVVVWPEVSGLAFGMYETSFVARAQEVARQNGIYLVVPLFTVYPNTERLSENKLLLIDPTGTIVFEHVKYGGNIMEGTLPGDGKLQAVDTPFGVFSGVICWDMDYPAVIQQTGLNGTGLLLVPSNDWFEIDPLHSHMAVFRAIENGTSIVRQVDNGLSIAVDPYGRILAQTDFFGTTDHTIVAQVPTKHVNTIYTLFGRYFEWLCLAGFLYVVIRAWIAPRQTN